MNGRAAARTAWPVVAFAALLFATYHRIDLTIVRATGVPLDVVVPIIAFVGWAVGSLAVVRLIGVVIWDRVGTRGGRRPPRLLVQLSSLAVFVVAGVVIATDVFGMSLTGVIATSSVIGLVVGFAVKSLISDTFSGIALNLDSGFAIGDFVQVISRGIPGRLIGRVTEINWRSTHIATPENCVLVVPNTMLSESMVLNLSRPQIASEFEQVVVLDFEVPSDRAVRVLTAALQAAALDNPAIFDTKARITETSVAGVHYKIKYMLDPSRFAPGKAKHLIFGHMLRHLTAAGITLAHPKQDNWLIEGGPAHFRAGSAALRGNLLAQVDLFRDLGPEDLAMLTDRMQEQYYRPGAAVIRSGDAGESMFVLSEGLVSVRIAAAEDEVDVARLAPGDFFGEMSLLTGEPRSATVVAVTDATIYEIRKDDMAALFDRNPGAAEVLSKAAAERRVLSSAAVLKATPQALEAEKASIAGQILARMTKFFGGRRRRPVPA